VTGGSVPASSCAAAPVLELDVMHSLESGGADPGWVRIPPPAADEIGSLRFVLPAGVTMDWRTGTTCPGFAIFSGFEGSGCTTVGLGATLQNWFVFHGAPAGTPLTVGIFTVPCPP
jgi:hypothetical protein